MAVPIWAPDAWLKAVFAGALPDKPLGDRGV
jgi:hypothetical protein